METKIYSFKDLKVWQKAIELSVAVYSLTDNFPRREVFGLCSQMRRAAVSVASNIAEGRNRGTKKDFIQFLRISLGSCGELETQLKIESLLNDTGHLDYSQVNTLVVEVIKMLHGMIKKLTLST